MGKYKSHAEALNSKYQKQYGWDEKSELSNNGSYYILHIHNYFKYIIKKYETLIRQQFKYRSTEFRTKLHSRLNLGIILSS